VNAPDDRVASTLAEIRADHEAANAFGASDPVPRLLAAVEAALEATDEWTEGSYGTGSALDEDRGWVRAACGARIREAITTALTGTETPGDH
jgi:hypothetical protein